MALLTRRALFGGGTLFCLATGLSLSVSAQTTQIPGPSRTSTLPMVASPPPRLSLEAGSRSVGVRRAASWKGAVILGVFTGAVFGLVVSQQDDEGGGDRSTGNKVKSGLLAGAMIAVPVTVIFALLTADD